MMKKFNGNILFLDRSDINTDEIIPAKYLTEVSKAPLGPHLLEDLKLEEFVPQRDIEGKSVIVTRANFGCGSSREHAPWALTSWGIRAIISTGFADIFRNNSLKNGLLPIVVDEDTHRQLFEGFAASPDAQVTVDLEERIVHLPGDEDVPFDIDPFAHKMLLEGKDEIGWLVDRTHANDAWEAANPARVDTRPSSVL